LRNGDSWLEIAGRELECHGSSCERRQKAGGHECPPHICDGYTCPAQAATIHVFGLDPSERGVRTSRMRTVAALLFVSLLAAARTVPAQPSSNLDDYVLFAEEILRADALLVPCGDIGVNSTSGLFRETRGITVAGNCIGNTARMDMVGSCGALYANFTVKPTNPPIPFTPPVLTGSLASNCGFPSAPFGCNLAAPVTVNAGDTVTLPPGVYGHLTVK